MEVDDTGLKIPGMEKIFTRAKSTSAFYFDEYLLMNNILIFLSGLLKTNQVIPEHPTDDHRDSPLFFF